MNAVGRLDLQASKFCSAPSQDLRSPRLSRGEFPAARRRADLQAEASLDSGVTPRPRKTRPEQIVQVPRPSGRPVDVQFWIVATVGRNGTLVEPVPFG